jgi:osmoprotectant transport system substrate-binding protein
LRPGIARIVTVLAALATLGGCGDERPAAEPVAGERSVTLGTRSVPDQLVVGHVYEQALEARGYGVELKQNIGSPEIARDALRSGQIDVYPESIATFNRAVAGDATTYPSMRAAYAAARRHAAANRLALVGLTRFATVEALAVRPALARRHDLATIADLARVRGLRLGAAPELLERPDGLAALRRVYGLRVRFAPLTAGLQYEALQDGLIDVAHVRSTDGELQDGEYVVLEDPAHVFGFQQMTPVVRAEVLAAQGPRFRATLEQVDAALTTAAMRELNRAVQIDRESPADAARRFLESEGIV